MDPVIVEVYSDAAREMINHNIAELQKIEKIKRSAYFCVLL